MERQAKDGTIYQQVGPDEWTPVTRQAKDGSTYKKVGADEWQKLEPEKPATPEDPRNGMEVLKDGLDVRNWPKNMMAGLQKVDEYTGAPVRKFVTESLTGKDMKKAPTGAEQAKMMGATDVTYGEKFGVPSYLGGNISPADIYGVGLEAVQDPLLLAGKAAQGVKNLIKGGETVAETFRARQALKATQSQAAQAAAEAGARSKATIAGGGVEVEQGGKLFSVQAPKSLEELRQWKPQANAGEMPGKGRLQQIEQTVPDLQTKPLKYHYDMMENPKAMKELKLQFENLPTEDAKQIAAYNQQIVEESGRKVQETVSGITPSGPKGLSEAGDDLISTVKDKYNAEKEILAPVFQQLQKSPRLSRAETMGLAQAIGENTKLGKLMSVGEDGRIFLEKNTPRTGLSNNEHAILAQVIDDMNNGMTFKEMQNARDFLRKSMDTANPAATAEIGKVRSIMLGQMEEMAARHDIGVGETFKKYAINERSRENVEKIIGGKIETFDAMYAANPERVVQKVFSNPNYAKVVGEYVGPEKMQELVASYVQNGIKGAYDSATGFNPSKLRTWLKSNAKFMDNYAGPEITQRLNALADYGYYGKRFLDEVNPSGTAASLINAIKPEGFVQKVRTQGIKAAVESETIGRVATAVKQKQATSVLNEALGTKNPSMMQNAGANIQKKLGNSTNVSKTFEDAKKVQFGTATARGTIRDVTPRASADKNETQKKGPDKWANDGIEMILKANQSDIDRDTLEKLKGTKEGKMLLFEASSAKDKKAMERVLQKIRSASRNEGE